MAVLPAGRRSSFPKDSHRIVIVGSVLRTETLSENSRGKSQVFNVLQLGRSVSCVLALNGANDEVLNLS